MDSLFQPFPFVDNIKFPKQSFADEVAKTRNLQQDVIIAKIKEQAKSIEVSYPSLAQTFENLVIKIRDDFDAKCKGSNKFEMLPVIANEKYYPDSADTSDVKLIRPDQLFKFLKDSFTAINVKDYSYLLKYGISPSSYPLAKLMIILKLISKQTKFDIDEEVKKEIISEDRSQNNLDQKPQIFTRLRKIPNHPIENWIKSQEITNLIQKSPNQTIYINSSPGSYIVLDNSQGRCIINVASQKYAINNNDFKDLSGIIDNRYKITSAAIIDGCLTFILLNNYEVSVIVYRNSEIPTDPGMAKSSIWMSKTFFRNMHSYY
ncbi:ubiquitin protein ligase protein [Trichomonas vaginalis G3]|uniref:ubiquitin protein ligase protein n=1 Tax=Trichomonas vaginalis (strain ATCC PRA-98 / G3) TaxID=412133 RepID=UPI0021E5A532|nr:ubiquitin protein ligase protein [Trichomonas vaginalis G3]KAI5516750.1 ubiquitin protein ligase protein [Trichomonas vaginalis G3]